MDTDNLNSAHTYIYIVYICVCIYIYMYVHTQIYIYICTTHTYTHTQIQNMYMYAEISSNICVHFRAGLGPHAVGSGPRAAPAAPGRLGRRLRRQRRCWLRRLRCRATGAAAGQGRSTVVPNLESCHGLKTD